jgi:hypothetical protein
LIKQALDSLAREVESAKAELGGASAPLASQITEAVLGGAGPEGGMKGARN